jgi:hypothetical protein
LPKEAKAIYGFSIRTLVGFGEKMILRLASWFIRVRNKLWLKIEN